MLSWFPHTLLGASVLVPRRRLGTPEGPWSREPCWPQNQQGRGAARRPLGGFTQAGPEEPTWGRRPGRGVDGQSWAARPQLPRAGPGGTRPFCGGTWPAVGAGKGGGVGASGLLQLGVLPQGHLSSVIRISLLLDYLIIRSFVCLFLNFQH